METNSHENGPNANTEQDLRQRALAQLDSQTSAIAWGMGITLVFTVGYVMFCLYVQLRSVESAYEPHEILWPVPLLLLVVLVLGSWRRTARKSRELVQYGQPSAVNAFWTDYDDILALMQPDGRPLLAKFSSGKKARPGERTPARPFKAWLFAENPALTLSGEAQTPVALFATSVATPDPRRLGKSIIKNIVQNTYYWGRMLPNSRRKAIMLGRKRRFMALMLVMMLGSWAGCGLLYVKTQDKIAEINTRGRLAQESLHWPATQGLMAGSKLRLVRIGRGRMKVNAWVLDVAYAYVVDGKALHGDRLTFCEDPQRKKSLVREKQRQYPLLQPVKVHYDPQDPGTSVLEPGGASRCENEAGTQRFYIHATPFFLAFFGAIFVWAMVRKQLQFRRLERNAPL